MVFSTFHGIIKTEKAKGGSEMKKILGLGLGACLVLGLVACGTEKEIETEEDNQNIVFYHTLRESTMETLASAIEQFEEANPGWTVEDVNLGVYDEVYKKVLEDKDSGQTPDLVYCLPEHVASYKEKSMIVGLDSFVNHKELGYTPDEKNMFVKAFYEEGKAYGDDVLYSLPFLKQTEVIYTQQTLYPATWEAVPQFVQYKDAPYILGSDSTSNLFMTMAAQLQSDFTSATGEHILFDTTKNREFVQMLKTWHDAGYYTNPQEAYLDVSAVDFLIASTSGAIWQNRSYDIKVAPIPAFFGKELKVPFQGASLCMMKKSQTKMEKTWTFMKDYLLTPEAQASFSMETGYNPVLKSTYEVPEYQAWLLTGDGSRNSQGIIPLVALVCSAYVDYYYFPAPFTGLATARTEVGKLIDDVLSGVKSLDKAFLDAVANCRK